MAFEFWGLSLQFSSNASANLLVFVAKCLGVSWDPLGLAWVFVGPFFGTPLGTLGIRSMDLIYGSDPRIWSVDRIHGSDLWIRSMDPIHGSDPWIRSMVLFDLRRKIDFLTSFKGFAELSFFFRASGDNFLHSFFLTFWYHLETLRSYPFFLVPPGVTFCALSFLFFEDVCFYVETIDDW